MSAHAPVHKQSCNAQQLGSEPGSVSVGALMQGGGGGRLQITKIVVSLSCSPNRRRFSMGCAHASSNAFAHPFTNPIAVGKVTEMKVCSNHPANTAQTNTHKRGNARPTSWGHRLLPPHPQTRLTNEYVCYHCAHMVVKTTKRICKGTYRPEGATVRDNADHAVMATSHIGRTVGANHDRQYPAPIPNARNIA